jgi:allophanate hydrolase subunit 1
MVDWDSDSLALVQVGDQVRFRAISRDEFLELGGNLDEL